MNGISLLLLLSSIGVSHAVETGTNGQPVFAIHIESLLVGPLESGEVIQYTVPEKDRGLRRFKIAITPESGGRPVASSREFNSRTGGDLFNYEPAMGQDGEIQYWVQISPERLKSLANGIPIEGEVANEIPSVERFVILVGLDQLPSQRAAAGQGGSAEPAPMPGNTASVIPATASEPPALTKTQYQAPQQPTTQTPRYPADPVTQYGNRVTDARNNWRNSPDQSTVAPPPFTSNVQPQATIGNYQRPGTSTTTGTGGYAPTTGQSTYPNQQYTQPQYSQPAGNQPQYQTNPTGQPQFDPNSYAAQHGNYQPNYQSPGTAGYTQVASRPDTPTTAGTAAPPVTTAGWTNSANPTQPAAATPAASATKLTEPERPWTPLILTTLALFASLGANAYLGWLAWSFFWRFRDAVTESARTRSHHSRQAA